jgi:hypothetical protein
VEDNHRGEDHHRGVEDDEEQQRWQQQCWNRKWGIFNKISIMGDHGNVGAQGSGARRQTSDVIVERQAKAFTKLETLECKREKRFLISQAMGGMELFQINTGMAEKELMAREKASNKPHGDFGVLMANKFSMELQALQPQGEATFVVRDGFIRTLNNFVGRGGVEGRSTGAIDIRKMKTEEIIEHSEAITIDGLLADGAAKNRGGL